MLSKTLYSSKSGEYITPKWLYDQLNKEFHFDLDPCTTKDNPLNTRRYFTKKDNGLEQDWYDSYKGIDTTVFINPPYGRNTVLWWVKKAYSQNYAHGMTIVMLLPARVDTYWFHTYVYNQPNVEVRFLKGRLKFENSQWSAPFPSMIVIFR